MLMLGRKQVSPGYFPFKTIESATNCILEIPQNIKLEISGDTFTIKSGSTIVLVGETYTTYTLTSDTIVDYSTILPAVSDGLYYIFANSNGTVTRSGWIRITNCFSGTPLPNASDYPNSSVFFETSEKKKWYNNNGTWVNLGGSYPLGLFEVKNHQLSFAKDSNGNDMIFNGFGFIGQTKYILPDVKILLSAGKYNDGTNRNITYINNSLQLSTSGGTYIRRIFIREGALQITTNAFYYDNSTNLWYDQSDNPINGGCTYIGDCDTLNGIVTNFTINPPLGYWRYFVKMVQ